MAARLMRVVVSVSDMQRSLGFYRDLLDLDGEVNGVVARMSAGDGIELMLHERECTPSDLAIAAGFAVPELDRTCDTWKAKGGIIIDEPAAMPWGERMAVVHDPDGHIVCLIQQVG